MSTITELEDKVKELMNEIETLKQQEKIEKFEYLLENYEPYWIVYNDGDIFDSVWTKDESDCKRYEQGHIFKTKLEAKRERDKRALLTRFRQFRDKCNGDWEPDFDNHLGKHFISWNHTKNVWEIHFSYNLEDFNLFGYFRKEPDAARAIELFGDEIKRLWVDES